MEKKHNEARGLLIADIVFVGVAAFLMLYSFVRCDRRWIPAIPLAFAALVNLLNNITGNRDIQAGRYTEACRRKHKYVDLLVDVNCVIGLAALTVYHIIHREPNVLASLIFMSAQISSFIKDIKSLHSGHDAPASDPTAQS